MAADPWRRSTSVERRMAWRLEVTRQAWTPAAAASKVYDLTQQKRGARSSLFSCSVSSKQKLFSLRFEFGVDVHAAARGFELSLPRLEAGLADGERVVAGGNVNFRRCVADEASIERNIRIRGHRRDGNL